MASPAKVAVSSDEPSSEDASGSVAIATEADADADAGIGENAPAMMPASDTETKVRLKALRNLVSGGWASKKEIYSWYAYDFANSVFSSVLMALFLPLLLVYLADDHACPWKSEGHDANATVVYTCQPVEILQNTFSDRAHCIARYGLGSSFLLSVLRFFDRMAAAAPEWAEWTDKVLEYGAKVDDWPADWNPTCTDVPWLAAGIRNTTMNGTVFETADTADTATVEFDVKEAACPAPCPVAAHSSNASLVPAAGLVVTRTSDADAGAGTRRYTVKVTPELWARGSAAITLVADGQATNATFAVRVNKTEGDCYGEVEFLGMQIRSYTYSSTIVSMSVVFQGVAFISLSALGDFGANRKRILIATCTAGAILCMLFLATPSFSVENQYAYTGVITIAANVVFGLSIIMYNAYLPFLTLAHPEMKKLAETTKNPKLLLGKYVELEDTLSHMGMMWGYIGGVLGLIVSFTVVIFESSYMGLYIVCALMGLWWLGFAFPAFCNIETRPGPPFPNSYGKFGVFGWVAYSWFDMYAILAHARTLPQTWRFLLCFFLYSDTYSTIGSIGILFAKQEFQLDLVPYLMALATLSPLFAAVGNYAQCKWEHGQPALWMPKRVVAKMATWTQIDWVKFNMVMLIGICAWGCLGLIPGMPIGMTNWWELFVFVFFYGFALGPIQAYSRTLLAELTPPGMEAEFFGLFELTDKGSSWVGPLMCAVLFEATGSMRSGFVYLFLIQLLPLYVLHKHVDVEAGQKEARSMKTMMFVRARRSRRGRAGGGKGGKGGSSVAGSSAVGSEVGDGGADGRRKSRRGSSIFSALSRRTKGFVASRSSSTYVASEDTNPSSNEGPSSQDVVSQ